MQGFVHSPLSDIDQIRRDLRDRYQEGFPIVKELLQNADDANASCLHIGWFPGFPDNAHPLLIGPALFVVNDGEFTSKDQDGIRRIGISAKASDRAAIGKFGLGLKSVFHLCEAFFYCWSGQDTFLILNPWYDNTPPIHEDWEWDEKSSIARETRQAIIGCLSSLELPNFSHWLCLWMPLRQERHCEKVASIIKNYPGEESEGLESVFPSDLAVEISEILPLLRNLETVSAWNTGRDGSLEMLFQVNLDQGATRCRYRGSEQNTPTIAHGEQLPMQGTMNVTACAEPINVRYIGFEMMADLPIFCRLLQSNYWPTVITTDRESGAEQENKEKADAHCAAYFVEKPAESRGSLRIQQAVFLPVGDPKETQPCEGKSDFTLMLHGYFFPNAGRTDIEIPKDEIADAVNNETHVRLKWNYELYVSGTLPLVIPALNRFAKKGNFSAEKVRRLTETLAQSNTFRKFRKFICRNTQWVRRLNASSAAWERLDNPNEEILEIPPPPNSAPNRPNEVFPNLRELASQHVIVFHGDPRLTAQKEASKWHAELLAQMLHAVPVQTVFGSRGMLKYLVEFLKDCTEDARSGVFDVLQQLISQAFATVDLGQLRGNRSEIKNYLALLGNSSCFPLPKNLSGEVFQRLFQLELRVLLVPEDLIPEEPHQLLVESLCNKDALKILEFVPTLGENRELERPKQTLVQQVIKASHWDKICEQCNSLMIFTAYDCRSESDVSISLSQLRELKHEGMLFTGRSTSTQAKYLQQALHRESVYLIPTERETLTTLGLDDITPCNEGACLQVLQSKPALNRPSERVNLLNALLPKIEGIPEHKETVRYLIHAHPSDDNLPLFMEASTGQELWPRIAHQVLRTRDEEWRVIDNVLGNRIAPQFWQPLGIHEFGADGIAKLILEVGPERVDCTIFSIDERQQILREMNNIEVLRRLNIYDNVNGNPVRINPEQSYWQDDFPIEEIPKENITILRRLPKPISWKQERLLNQFLNAEAAIRIVLETENPHQHWRLILDALNCRENILAASELNQKLRAVKWLPIDAGRPPQDVIYLKDMEDEIARIVAQFGDSFVDVSMLPEEFRAHPGYKRKVQRIIPPRDDALEMLGEMMAEAEEYHIGDIDSEKLDIKVFIATFSQAPPQLMSACSMISHVLETFDDKVCREHLLPRLCQKLPIPRTVEILKFISERHEKNSTKKNKDGIHDIFNQYLNAATEGTEFRKVFEQIRLLSRDGNWKSPAELCLDSEGIHPDDLLDEKQSEVLIDRVQASRNRGRTQSHELLPLQGNEEQKFNESAARLEQYFDAWEGTVPNEVIGGFLSLLGNHPRLLELSEQYLGNRTVDRFRSQLDRYWEITPYSSAVGANENIHETLKKQRFLVEVFEDGTVKVTNLLGLSFHARIEQKEFDSLFVGSANEQFRYKTGMNYRVNRIGLRLVQPDRLQRHLLLDFIKNSAGMLLDKVYKQTIQNLDEVFNDLAQSEQLDIKIAQNLLLDHVFSTCSSWKCTEWMTAFPQLCKSGTKRVG